MKLEPKMYEATYHIQAEDGGHSFVVTMSRDDEFDVWHASVSFEAWGAESIEKAVQKLCDSASQFILKAQELECPEEKK